VLEAIPSAAAQGRLLGLIGRIGAGKTTCLNVAMGLLPASAGSVEVFGSDVTGLPPEEISLRGVALVPQGRRVFKSLTVSENLMVAARRAAVGVRAPWSLERACATFPRVAERRKQLASLLSGGEQQMLAIARALVGNPRLLLMDEPSEGLAPQVVAEVGRTIARLKGEGLSIVLVEQNIRLTLELADDIVILNSGSVVFAGTGDQITINDAIVAHHLGVH